MCDLHSVSAFGSRIQFLELVSGACGASCWIWGVVKNLVRLDLVTGDPLHLNPALLVKYIHDYVHMYLIMSS